MPDLAGSTWTVARSLSFDGSTVIADGANIWTRTSGTRRLFDVFSHAGLNTSGRQPFGNLFFVDYSGLQFAGSTVSSSGECVWRAALPPGGTCYANCDLSTAAPTLNAADFACFLSLFAAGHPMANCDGSTSAPTLTINDFICFQSAFAAGCP